MNRNTWMFPRNKRRINPLDTALILRALYIVTNGGQNDFWKQKQQDEFATILNELDLKSGGNLRDKRSGGARTYVAQYEALGLAYEYNNKIWFTQRGEDLVLLNSNLNATDLLQYSVLMFQYPNSYSMKPNVRIDSGISLRPFQFLIELAGDPDLNGLSDNDALIPIVFGRTRDSFRDCKEKILKLRCSPVEAVIPDTQDIRTSKTLNNNYNARIKDLLDIANTFRNVMLGVGLIELFSTGDETRYRPTGSATDLAGKVADRKLIDFQGLPKDQAMFQYGLRPHSRKDTRRDPKQFPQLDLLSKSSYIQNSFRKDVRLPASTDDVVRFVDLTVVKMNTHRTFVYNALEPILQDQSNYLDAYLVEVSKGGTKVATEFERSVAKVFQEELCFSSEWTGRLKSKTNRVGGFADVYLYDKHSNLCGIVDTKSMREYSLPHEDVSKMAHSYVKASLEVYPNSNVGFILYISHLISDGAKRGAQHLYDELNIPVVLCSIYGFNRIRRELRGKDVPHEVIATFTAKQYQIIC
jgi:hypothetical protein